MIRYRIATGNPNNHYINIEARFATLDGHQVEMQLPAWRPGRYELGNFAQNIRSWAAYNEKGKPLPFHKTSKDCWFVDTAGTEEVTVRYDYYANQLDAGNTYYNEKQLYVNPVNCLVYLPNRINEHCELQLSGLPAQYKIASALVFDDQNIALAQDFHTLADSPFFASDSLVEKEYQIGGCSFNIWIQGDPKPIWNRIIADFKSFSEKQIALFWEMPVQHYHFLFQMPDYKYYHGVEHLASTVICLGPADNLMTDIQYADFLGISSHELFHSWNVKSIRPAEMFPYDYARENYTPLHYVTEGVTTYYGDLMLLRSGGYSWETYAAKTAKTIERHQHNFGRLFQSLSEASMDSWLDGYKPGAPDRKISFYQKGMIVALMLDLDIRRETGNKYNLDAIMQQLYHEFAKKNKGYTEAEYLQMVSHFGGKEYKPFFESYIWGLDDLIVPLNELIAEICCELIEKENPLYFEDKLGFRMLDMDTTGRNTITHIAPGSPADKSGFSVGDEIIAVNAAYVDKNLHEVLRKHRGTSITLNFIRNRKVLTASIIEGEQKYYPLYQIVKTNDPSESQKENFKLWAHQEF